MGCLTAPAWEKVRGPVLADRAPNVISNTRKKDARGLRLEGPCCMPVVSLYHLTYYSAHGRNRAHSVYRRVAAAESRIAGKSAPVAAPLLSRSRICEQFFVHVGSYQHIRGARTLQQKLRAPRIHPPVYFAGGTSAELADGPTVADVRSQSGHFQPLPSYLNSEFHAYERLPLMTVSIMGV